MAARYRGGPDAAGGGIRAGGRTVMARPEGRLAEGSIVDYVEAPVAYTGGRPGLFLAGGITGCPDWQAEARRHLAGLPVAVFNPRRTGYPLDDPAAAETQIEWEFRHLRRADVVLFWFAAGPALQPIALYELGAHAADPAKRIAVGCDPAYPRRRDVVLQLGHVRPGVRVSDSLEATCAQAGRLIGGQPAGMR